MSFVTHFLPRRRLSQLVGTLMHWEGPQWWRRWSVSVFAKIYKIRVDEAEKPLEAYLSIGDFFVRKLKQGVRPLAASGVLHPADSVITQSGPIQAGTMIQAKGLSYDLREFTEDSEALKKWGNGYFLTYYLCPTDYHRVHSPVDGKITLVRHIPGDLWPVNQWSTNNIPMLFVKNERVVVEIETSFGPVGLVLVGATNVGSIELAFDASIKGNRPGPQLLVEKKMEPTIPVAKGDEVGLFRMGSTVVMLYPEQFKLQFQNQLNLGPQVQVGQALI